MRKRKGVMKICPICNCNFPSRLNSSKKFCSIVCSNKSTQKRVELECAWCKKRFKRAISKSKGIVFCSRNCKDTAQRLDGIKEIHPPHYGSKYNTYHELINRTKNPYCIDCKIDKRYLLMVHHMDGNRNNNEIENLEIVCGNCHMKRHLQLVENAWLYRTAALTPRELLCEL